MKKLREFVKYVEGKIDYTFENVDLLFQAFTRRSYSHENGGENNEILEFIGDAVLSFYVTKILMDRYGYIKEDASEKEFAVKLYDNEGSLTEIKKNLVNKEMLAHRIDVLGFKDFLRMGKGDIEQHQENEPSVKEDLFETILGAIALDSNWNTKDLQNSVQAMLNVDYYLENGFSEGYVALIQEWNQKVNGKVPVYTYKELNDGKYSATLVLNTKNGDTMYSAIGSSKRKARLNVAEKAYHVLEKNGELLTIKDELPEKVTLDNAINVLQELAQKGYISMPEYIENNIPVYDKDGNPKWQYACHIRSEGIVYNASADSKKLAKKYAAYLCICKICDLKNQYK